MALKGDRLLVPATPLEKKNPYDSFSSDLFPYWEGSFWTQSPFPDRHISRPSSPHTHTHPTYEKPAFLHASLSIPKSSRKIPFFHTNFQVSLKLPRAKNSTIGYLAITDIQYNKKYQLTTYYTLIFFSIWSVNGNSNGITLKVNFLLAFSKCFCSFALTEHQQSWIFFFRIGRNDGICP